jgi:protein-S-isoprenylcysteine O-methyltransferase Ste14
MSDVISVFLLQHRKIRQALKMMRWPLGAATAAALIWFAQPDWLWVAVPLVVVGELIQMWSSANIQKHQIFHPCGPYTLVRNPMYDGRFLVLLGAMMVPATVWPLPIYLLWFCIYVTSRVRREEKGLSKRFGEPYQTYLAEVPRFIPIPGRRTRAHGPLLSFRWDLAVRNHEHLNVLTILCFFGLVTLRLTLR